MRQSLKNTTLYLSKDKFQLWGESFSEVFTFVFSADHVRDQEVVNREALITSVQAFISANKIPPLKIVIILSSEICFEKDVPDSANPFEKDELLDGFTDLIPFEKSSEKIIKVEGKQKIVGTNKALWETIYKGFISTGSVVSAVVPSLSLGIPSLVSVFDPQYANSAFTKAESIREANLLEPSLGPNTEPSPSPVKGKVSHTREILLGGVFLVLIIVFIALVIIQKPFSPPPGTRPPPEQSAPSPQALGIMDESIIVNIHASPDDINSAADSLEKTLIQKGFREIRIYFSSGKSSRVTIITFPTAISPEKQNAVISATKSLFNDIKINTSDINSNIVDIRL